MAHFLIYLPGAQGAGPQLLETVGLADFIGGAEFLASEGPDRGMGSLVAWRKPGSDRRFCFAPDEQTWIPAASVQGCELGQARYWVGCWNDSPPSPTNLLRPYAHRGKKCTLGDGNAWEFPETRELPRDAILADDGTWKFELQRQYHDLHLESLEWLSRLASASSDGESARLVIGYGEIVEFLFRALRLNYRITREVASHLKLFSTANLKDPLWAVSNVAVLTGEEGR